MKIIYIYLIIIFLIGAPSCRQKAALHQKESKTSAVTPFEDPPEWAKQVVWYQIFVERFRNGDPTNDPRPVDIEGSYPGIVPDSWQITPWTQDWYRPDPYFSELESQKDFLGNPISSFGQKAQLRRYGGDLQGVLDKIDYLDSLGVTAIYFNPLNDAPSLHKYDARHWRHIDRNFGPDPEKDAAVIAEETPDDPATWQYTEADKLFLRIIKAFHERGIRVILDYSWNHTGITFWAWKEILADQTQSAYADWYWIRQFDDPGTAENEFEYRGWAGTWTLPEIKETHLHDLEKPVQAFEGNLYSEVAKQHIFRITERWLDPNGDGNPADGVDGFRLDVAAEVPLDFWREYRKVVRKINPDAYLLGEVWWEKWPDRLLDPEPFVRGDIFDAPMNYRWYRSARHFFNASPAPIPVSEFVDSLRSYASNLRQQTIYSMMNLTSSHDAPRVLTSLYNENKYKYNASPGPKRNYKIHKPDADTYQTLRLLLAKQFTYPGSPHIWAGDEMGMWGADDPSNRKPLIWPDYEFEPEAAHPLGAERPVDEMVFNHQLFADYRKLIQIRKEYPVLSYGALDFILIDDENQVLAYSRYDSTGEEVIAIFNTSTESKTITVPVKTGKNYVDIWRNTTVEQRKKVLTLELPPRRAAILVND